MEFLNPTPWNRNLRRVRPSRTPRSTTIPRRLGSRLLSSESDTSYGMTSISLLDTYSSSPILWIRSSSRVRPTRTLRFTHPSDSLPSSKSDAVKPQSACVYRTPRSMLILHSCSKSDAVESQFTPISPPRTHKIFVDVCCGADLTVRLPHAIRTIRYCWQQPYFEILRV